MILSSLTPLENLIDPVFWGTIKLFLEFQPTWLLPYAWRKKFSQFRLAYFFNVVFEEEFSSWKSGQQKIQF